MAIQWNYVFSNVSSGVVSGLGSYGIVLNSNDASSTSLTINAHASQTANLMSVTNAAGSSAMWITSGGQIQTRAGVGATSNPWGYSFAGGGLNDFIPEHVITDNTGNFDTTGNVAGESYFFDIVNSPFTPEDASTHRFIAINSGTYVGGIAEIDEYLSPSGVILHHPDSTWDSDLSGVDYAIIQPPQFITIDGDVTHIHTGIDGHAKISPSAPYTGEGPIFSNEATMGADDVDHTSIITKANGFSGIHTQHITYQTGAIVDGDEGRIIQISINDREALGGKIDGLLFETTNAGSNVTSHAIHIGKGFTSAMQVTGSISELPAYGYEVTSGTVVDRVNSQGAGNDAFINTTVNVAIFDNNADYILIGANTTFEVLTCVLVTESSKNVLPTFQYSTGNGTWSTLVVDDATNGFQRSGVIDWEAPGDWATGNQAQAVADISAAYYLKITRTVGGVIPTLPIERDFKINKEQGGDTGMEITGHGIIKLPYLTGAPARLENGMIWMEGDGLHIYYDDSESVVAGV